MGKGQSYPYMSEFWKKDGDKDGGRDGGSGATTPPVPEMCIISKAYHTDSACTSAVSYTNKVALFMNECTSNSASTSFKMIACSSS